jgi:hypothetical protein
MFPDEPAANGGWPVTSHPATYLDRQPGWASGGSVTVSAQGKTVVDPPT